MSWAATPSERRLPRRGAERPESPPVPREVLRELARGFLLELGSEDPRGAARFAHQFLNEQRGGLRPSESARARPRTVTGPLPRASIDGRSLEPGP